MFGFKSKSAKMSEAIVKFKQALNPTLKKANETLSNERRENFFNNSQVQVYLYTYASMIIQYSGIGVRHPDHHLAVNHLLYQLFGNKVGDSIGRNAYQNVLNSCEFVDEPLKEAQKNSWDWMQGNQNAIDPYLSKFLI